MLVYHGSRHRFKKLRISKSLVECRSTAENEGYGIYFSTDRTVAESYGPYVYVLDINEAYFKDFRKRPVCEEYIFDLCNCCRKKTSVDISKYVVLEDTINRMHCGGLAISGVGRELNLLLDSKERFYQEVCETKRQRLYQFLKNYDKHHLDAYMFEYHIKNIGVIKNIKEDVVKIIRREESY